MLIRATQGSTWRDLIGWATTVMASIVTVSTVPAAGDAVSAHLASAGPEETTTASTDTTNRPRRLAPWASDGRVPCLYTTLAITPAMKPAGTSPQVPRGTALLVIRHLIQARGYILMSGFVGNAGLSRRVSRQTHTSDEIRFERDGTSSDKPRTRRD